MYEVRTYVQYSLVATEQSLASCNGVCVRVRCAGAANCLDGPRRAHHDSGIRTRRVSASDSLIGWLKRNRWDRPTGGRQLRILHGGFDVKHFFCFFKAVRSTDTVSTRDETKQDRRPPESAQVSNPFFPRLQRRTLRGNAWLFTCVASCRCMHVFGRVSEQTLHMTMVYTPYELVSVGYVGPDW